MVCESGLCGLTRGENSTMGMPRSGTAWLGCLWRCATSWLSSPVRRIYLGYGMCLVSLLLLAALRQPSMAMLNASAFLVGVADATSQSGLYVFAASYHRPQYTAAVTLGSAIAGLAVGVLRLLTRGLFDTASLEGLRRGVAVLYVLSSVVIVGCLWALHSVVRDNHSLASRESAQPSEEEGTDAQDQVAERFKVHRETIRITWKPTLAAFLNFFITLGLFPGTITPSMRPIVAAEHCSTSKGWG